MTKETIKRALKRALEYAIIGALTSFALIPTNLEEPKQYLTAVGIGMLAGAIGGLKKAITGYIKYDK